MTKVRIGLFNYLISSNEAVIGTINNTHVEDFSQDCNAFINKQNTFIHAEVPSSLYYNSKYYLVKRIGVCAFRNSGIITIKIGKFVEEIQYRSLDWCSNLKKLEFDTESLLTRIDNGFGVNSSIKELHFPQFLSNITQSLLKYTPKLEKIYFGGIGIDCMSDLSSYEHNLTIFVLPNYAKSTFCNHSVKLVSNFPISPHKSCNANFSYRYLFSIRVFILSLVE